MKNKPASIALISLLLIGGISLMLVLVFSNVALNSFEQSYNEQSSGLSFYFAESCLEEAITQLELDPNYNSGSLSFSDGSCSISISGTGPYTVTVSAQTGSFQQNFQAELQNSVSGSVNNFTLLSWKEIE